MSRAEFQRCGNTCCPADRECCAGTCCAAVLSCIDGVCDEDTDCPEPLITVRGEQCCRRISGQTYVCGRFTCTARLSGTGPGDCDVWCDEPEEGTVCGPGVDGCDTGEGNGRACCCTVAGTETCVYGCA